MKYCARYINLISHTIKLFRPDIGLNGYNSQTFNGKENDSIG